MAGELRTYQLLIEVTAPIRAHVGRLGPCAFEPGRYVYTGSATRNLEARIARHLSSKKKLHWHIDHLLTQAGVNVVGVRRYREPECAINRAMPGSVPVPGFGASDCRHGCGSHLKYLGQFVPQFSPSFAP